MYIYIYIHTYMRVGTCVGHREGLKDLRLVGECKGFSFRLLTLRAYWAKRDSILTGKAHISVAGIAVGADTNFAHSKVHACIFICDST